MRIQNPAYDGPLTFLSPCWCGARNIAADIAVAPAMFAYSDPRRPSASRSLAQRVAIILAVVIQIGAGFLPQFGIGQAIGERSDAVRTLITPVGWAFAIWGPLFVLSVLFAIWQALPKQKNNGLLAQVGWPAAIALAAQGVWSTYTQIDNLTFVSVAIILVSLAALLYVARSFASSPSLTPAERLFAAPAFTALAAWLTAASVVNVAAMLKLYGVGGDAPTPGIAVAIIAIAALIAAVAAARLRGAPLYGLVFAYALYAINVAEGQRFPVIGWACFAGIAAVVAVTVWQLSRRDNRHHWFGGQPRPTLV